MKRLVVLFSVFCLFGSIGSIALGQAENFDDYTCSGTVGQLSIGHEANLIGNCKCMKTPGSGCWCDSITDTCYPFIQCTGNSQFVQKNSIISCLKPAEEDQSCKDEVIECSSEPIGIALNKSILEKRLSCSNRAYYMYWGSCHKLFFCEDGEKVKHGDVYTCRPILDEDGNVCSNDSLSVALDDTVGVDSNGRFLDGDKCYVNAICNGGDGRFIQARLPQKGMLCTEFEDEGPNPKSKTDRENAFKRANRSKRLNSNRSRNRNAPSTKRRQSTRSRLN